MKKPVVLDPHAGFPDPGSKPDESELRGVIGRGFASLTKLLTEIRSARPEVAVEWKFSPRAGWHLIYLREARRLFYLVPVRGDFRLSLIVGDKAIAEVRNGPVGTRLKAALTTAQRYPEGTAFSFNRATLDAELMLALLQAKIAH